MIHPAPYIRACIVLIPPALLSAGAYLLYGVPAALLIAGFYSWIEFRQAWSVKR
jgi:hypothetical protein